MPDSTYKNNAFVDGAIGKMNMIKINSESSIATIHYAKGIHIVGKLKNGKEEGVWNQYDKVGRVRKKVFFMNGSASQIKEYDTNGKLTYKTNTTIDF